MYFSLVDVGTIFVGRWGSVLPFNLVLAPTELGVRQFRLRVKPLEGEIDPRDNEKTAKVEVIDRKTRILLIAGGPMRDFLVLRNQLFRDKEVISDVWLQSGKPGISQEANELLFQFPESADELFEYDAIVAFDPDWTQLDAAQADLIEQWVAEEAGGMIVVAGPVHTSTWVQGPEHGKIRALYPVEFQRRLTLLDDGLFGSKTPWPIE